MSRNIRFFTVASLALVLVWALSSVSALAAPSPAPLAPSIRIEPATQRVVAGQLFTVSVTAIGGASVNTFGLRLNFNPAVIQYVSLATGSYLATAGSWSPVGPSSGVGYVDYGEYLQGTGSVSGDGVLATLTLRALTSGPGNLQLDPAFTFLVDPLGNDLGAALVDSTMSAYQVYTWVGNSSVDWTVGGNWSPANPPTQYDDAIISGAAIPNWPIVNTISTVYNLTLQAGAQVTLTSGGVLNIEGALTNNGALTEIKNAPSGSTTEFLHLRNAAATSDKYRGVDITPAANMGLTSVTIKGNQTQCTGNPTDELLTRCYNITPSTAANATLRFWYTEVERNNQTANALKLWHYAPWTQVGTPYTYSESSTTCSSPFCWMQAVNVSSYSPFGVGSGAVPNAITLSTLAAHADRMVWIPLGLALISFAAVLIAWKHRR